MNGCLRFSGGLNRGGLLLLGLVWTLGLPVVQAEEAVVPAAAVPTVRLSLAEAVERALSNNVDVVVAQFRTQSATGARKVARAGLLPQVSGLASMGQRQRSGEAMGFPQETVSTGQITLPNGDLAEFTYSNSPPEKIGPYDVANAGVSGSLVLFDPAQFTEYSAAKKDERVERYRLSAARQQVCADVADAYVRVLYAGELAVAAEKKVGLYEERVAYVRDERQAGRATDLDVEAEELSLSGARRDLRAARNSAEQTSRQLRQALSLDPGVRMELIDPLRHIPVQTGGEEATLDKVLTRRADYLAQKEFEDAAQDRRNAARYAWSPTLKVVGQYGMEGEYFSEGVEVWSAAGELELPLWDSLLRWGKLEQRQGELEQAKATRRHLEDVVADQLKTAEEDVGCLEESVAVAQQGVRVAEMALAREEDSRKAGRNTDRDVLEAKVALSEAQCQLASSIYEQQAAGIRWFAAIGDVYAYIDRFNGIPQGEARQFKGPDLQDALSYGTDRAGDEMNRDRVRTRFRSR